MGKKKEQKKTEFVVDPQDPQSHTILVGQAERATDSVAKQEGWKNPNLVKIVLVIEHD